MHNPLMSYIYNSHSNRTLLYTFLTCTYILFWRHKPCSSLVYIKITRISFHCICIPYVCPCKVTVTWNGKASVPMRLSKQWLFFHELELRYRVQYSRCPRNAL